MPKLARELSALEVGGLRTDGMHAVGGVPGLYLQVNGQARSWVLRAVVGDKRRDMGLGGFPGVTMATARLKAREARLLIDQGSDPILERAAAKSALLATQASVVTFSEAVSRFLDAKASEWRNAKHRQQWVNTLKTYAAPLIGDLHVNDIRQEHVLNVLEPIWQTKTETAMRVRGRIESVLDWAAARGFRNGENPARWKNHLAKLLPNPSKIASVKHHAAMPFDEMPSFMRRLRQQDGGGAKALELAILTATRSGEVRGAVWSEFDLSKATWTVPAARMKGKRDHRVPLSEPAVSLLLSLPRLEGCDLVFPGAQGRPLSDMTLSAVLRRMGVPVVPHGFRSTFRDWSSERTAFSREVAEMALAHAVKDKTEAAYQRGDLLEKRREQIEAWAAAIG